jgi:cyclophilin family peptidyl-prolyl cis-trans isomerase
MRWIVTANATGMIPQGGRQPTRGDGAKRSGLAIEERYMKVSRVGRRGAGRNIEPLESRCLLSATVTSQIPAQAIDPAQGAQTLSLGSFFTDDAVPAGDTVVDIKTNLPAPNNHIPVLLTQSATPQTVANFLAYITSGEYANTIVHRSVPGFVIQAGGYTTDGSHISTFGTIPGESATETVNNATEGTIAMALSTGPDSATSEWFINLASNPGLDDTSDGGPFTAFGQTIYNGLNVAKDIASLDIVNDTSNPAWSTLPVHNFLGVNGQTVASVPSPDLVILNPVIVDGGLTYKVTSSNPRVVGATISGSSLNLTPVAARGTARITVTATDLGGKSVVSTFSVTLGSTGPAVLTPTLSGRLPATVIAGQKVAIHQTLSIANTGGLAYDAPATIDWFLSTSTTVDGSAIALPPAVTKNLRLNGGTHAAFPLTVPALPANVPAGTYYLLAQVVNQNGNTTVAASTSTITVTPPQIDLSLSIPHFVSTAKAGKPFIETIKVSNTAGNIAATGTVPILVATSADGIPGDSTALTSITKKINVPAGKSVLIPLSLVAPAAAGTSVFLLFDIDPNNTLGDIDLSNNLVESALPLTIH